MKPSPTSSTGALYEVDRPLPFDMGAIFYDGVKPAIKQVLKGDKSDSTRATGNGLTKSNLLQRPLCGSGGEARGDPSRSKCRSKIRNGKPT
jgi:hypothetical protein